MHGFGIPITTRLLCAVALTLPVATLSAQQPAASWWTGYVGTQANGPAVLGYWKFDGDSRDFTQDASAHKHQATLRGGKWNAEGRFGGALESFAGYPVADKSHGLHVASSPTLSPRSAFTVEMWIRAKEDSFSKSLRPVLLDMKYVRYNHTGFMLSLTPGGGDAHRQLAVEIGMGTRSETWYSQPFAVPAQQWRHIAFTYDARGTVSFFVDGAPLGQMTKPNAGPMELAARPLSIGDRIGSLYNGFPGFIDEVRITAGQQDFRPVKFVPRSERFVYQRMANLAKINGELFNQTREPITGATCRLQLPGGVTRTMALPKFVVGGSHYIEFILDTSLKPGTYTAKLTLDLPEWTGSSAYRSSFEIPLVIVPRALPHRLPVVMWGLGGTEGVLNEIPRLQQIGFTHCLGLRVDYQKVWDEGAKALPVTKDQVRAARAMLDAALENDIKIVTGVAPARWLRTAAVGKPFLRIDRKGNHHGRPDVSGVFQPVQDLCFNSGAALAKAYGDHPAFAAALLHTEVRGESQVSFHPAEREAYRQATGQAIPDEVTIKNGVQYAKLPKFPADRVIADDDPILQYLQWFWQKGDGWNELNSQLHRGLKQNMQRPDFWTFHDPAVRVPSISGSGGAADVLSHWTYSYPDPVRIGLCTDELLEMARAGGREQDVMKMTQVIWYRSQTAPEQKTVSGPPSPWVDADPDAAYITIAPLHLREAFWWKLARPIQGIMYHGWQSLVKTDSPGAYRHTNPNTWKELQRLVRAVVVPLGPTLMQVPDPVADVAFLESFTSQMFARRGTYGWNHTWAGDMYHVLMYAQLQPHVLYEESLLAEKLRGVRVLVMADCDVLTKSAVQVIQKFQAAGGLVIGDAEVCPAIERDFTIPRFSRTKQADVDRRQLQSAARELRDWLDSRYSRAVDSTSPDAVTRRRRFGTTDYIFAVNDRREFGSYVGGYGLVMEDGLPLETVLQLRRSVGHVYDLVQGRELATSAKDDRLLLPIALRPGGGRVLMVTDKPIQEIVVSAPKSATRGEPARIQVKVTDGQDPLDAVIPLFVQIIDPEGVVAEFSGHYGAAHGQLSLAIDFAPNDRLGVWEIRARELASGKSSAAYLRLVGE